MRIAVFGGSFDPVHKEHIALAKAAIKSLALDKLFIMPAFAPPHKKGKVLLEDKHRLEMCRLAFANVEGVYVSDMEMRREGRSYTVDTLRELTGEDRRLFLLCGTDMMLTLDGWRNSEEIFKLAYPVYIRREKDALIDKMIVQKIAEYNQKYGKVVRRIVTEPIEISSSLVREKVKNGEDVSHLITASVEKYIRDNHLYV